MSETLSRSAVELPGVQVETGTDVVSISRIRRLVTDGPTGFTERVFTDEERAYCDATAHPAEHYAARWCVKEAVRKVVADPGSVAFGDVATHRDGDAPRLVVSDTARRALAETVDTSPAAETVDTAVSLTHDRENDTAGAVVTVATVDRRGERP